MAMLIGMMVSFILTSDGYPILPAHSEPPAESSNNYILGIDHDKLFARVGLTLANRFAGTDREFKPTGVQYYFDKEKNPAQISSLHLAVHLSNILAHGSMTGLNAMISVGPSPVEGSDFGDERFVYLSQVSDLGGTIMFRRNNVFFWFRFDGSSRDALAAAAEIDRLLVEDREIAPRGAFEVTPRIVDVGIGEAVDIVSGNTVYRREVRIQPVFEGLRTAPGQESSIYFDIVSSSGLVIQGSSILQRHNGSYIIVVEPNKTYTNLKAVAIDSMNVIVIKDFTLNIEPPATTPSP